MQLVIDSDLPEGTYELEVKVEDRARNEKAMSFVKVVVRPVPELAFEKHVGEFQMNKIFFKILIFRLPSVSRSIRPCRRPFPTRRQWNWPPP